MVKKSFVDEIRPPWEGDSVDTSDPEGLSSSLVNMEPVTEVHTSWIPRASSLYSCCMRQRVLGHLHKVPMTSRVYFGSTLTFGIGTALHEWLQNSPQIFGDRRWGRWRCLACNRLHKFGPVRTKKCKCGARPEASVYEEVAYSVSDPPVTGHPDMFLKRGPKKKLSVVEFKSLNGDSFDSLVAPVIDHVWQISAYMKFAPLVSELEGRSLSKFGYIMYFSKKHISKGLPVKTFRVELQPHVVDEIDKKLELFEVGVSSSGRQLPSRISSCSFNMASWVAAHCPVRKQCMEAL